MRTGGRERVDTCEPGSQREGGGANRVSTERGGQQERAPPYVHEGGCTSEGRTSMGEGGCIMSEGSFYLLHPFFLFHFISFLILVVTLRFSTF